MIPVNKYSHSIENLLNIEKSIKILPADNTQKIKLLSEKQNEVTKIINDVYKETAKLRKIEKDTSNPFKFIKQLFNNSLLFFKGIVNQQAELNAVQTKAMKLQDQLECNLREALIQAHTEEVRTDQPDQQIPLTDLIKASKKILEEENKKLKLELTNYMNGKFIDSSTEEVIERLSALKGDDVQRILKLAKNVDALTQVESLLKVFCRSESKPGLSHESLNQLQTLQALLTSYQGAQATPEIKQLHALVSDMLADVHAVFQRGLESLLKMDEATMQTLRSLAANPDSPLEAETIRQCHDIYWSFHDPFESQIGMEGFCQSFLEALQGKESPFLTLVQEMGNTSKNALKEKVELLNKALKEIQSRGAGQKYTEFGKQQPQEAQAIKQQFLRNKRLENLGRIPYPLKINIIGGGPGGLMRALVASVKGHECRLIEMREHYSRDNMVKIKDTPLLNYFGIRDKLIAAGKINPDSEGNFAVKLKDLETILNGIAIDLHGDESFRLQGQAVDIVPGKDGKVNCLVKEGARDAPKKDLVLEADLHIDSTGARADVGKMLGIRTDQRGGAEVMVAAVFKKDQFKQIKQNPALNDQLPFVVPLSTPEYDYVLIQTNKELQTELKELNHQKDELVKQEKKLKASLQSFKTSSMPELYRGNIEASLSSTTVKRLQKRYGTGEEYDKKLIENGQSQLKKLETKRLKIQGKIDKALYLILSKQQNQKVTKDQVQSVASFNVELHQRLKPSTVYGASLVMFSGDSLATPDPKSGVGANHAIGGSAIFAKTLDDRLNGVSPEQTSARFNYASRIHMEGVTQSGLAKRRLIH